MIEINLFPWREHKKSHEKKMVFCILTAVIALSISIVITIHAVLSQQLTLLHHQVNAIDQIVKINEYSVNRADNNKKNHLLATKMMSNLIARRTRMMDLLNDLSEQKSNHIYFTKIQRTQNNLVFSGRARSVADLTRFLLHWRAVRLFSEIKVNEIQQRNNDSVYFLLKATEFKN